MTPPSRMFIEIVSDRRQAHHGSDSRPVGPRPAADRQRGTVLPSQPANPREDARPLVAAQRGHPPGRGQDRGREPGHRAAVRGRVPRRGPGRATAVGAQSPGQRDGRLSRADPRVLRAATGLHRRRGGRADLPTDRVAPQPESGAQLRQGHGPEVPARPRDPRAAQKNLAEHVEAQAAFLEGELKPRLEAARAGRGHVFFVDAAHFVFGTFLCCLWSFARIFVRAASGRQRFNVLGAWDAVTRRLIAVTNTTVVNTETMCELLRKIAAEGLAGPITLVLDNARYQHNAAVKASASELGITLLFLPSYSPNLNLIERLWKFIKRRSLYGRYHPTFADFRSAIEGTLDGLPTTHAESLAKLMTLNFQGFEDLSLLAA